MPDKKVLEYMGKYTERIRERKSGGTKGIASDKSKEHTPMYHICITFFTLVSQSWNPFYLISALLHALRFSSHKN